MSIEDKSAFRVHQDGQTALLFFYLYIFVLEFSSLFLTLSLSLSPSVNVGVLLCFLWKGGGKHERKNIVGA